MRAYSEISSASRTVTRIFPLIVRGASLSRDSIGTPIQRFIPPRLFENIVNAERIWGSVQYANERMSVRCTSELMKRQGV